MKYIKDIFGRRDVIEPFNTYIVKKNVILLQVITEITVRFLFSIALYVVVFCLFVYYYYYYY